MGMSIWGGAPLLPLLSCRSNPLSRHRRPAGVSERSREAVSSSGTPRLSRSWVICLRFRVAEWFWGWPIVGSFQPLRV